MALENCQLCKGTGWKLVPRSDGAAGKVAVACDCGMQDRAERVIERAQIPKRYEHCDFESYSTDVGATPQQTDSLKKAKLLSQGFVRDYPGAAEKGLLLMGPSGVGKTHLAVAALKDLIRRGHAGLFCDYRELLKEIQASYNPASESTEMGILEPIRTVEILVLDDLGASKPSDWVRDIVGIVLNARYNERRTTIITTNYYDNPAQEGEATRLPSGKLVMPTREDSLDQRIGSRMRSRLFEMCRTVEVIAQDFRRESTQAGRARARKMKTGQSLLEEWYVSQCNGDWEHSWGVKIETLDNPGWSISINLNETRAESRILDRLKIVRTEDDWIHYWVEKKIFQIRCGALNLTEAVGIFVSWFNS